MGVQRLRVLTRFVFGLAAAVAAAGVCACHSPCTKSGEVVGTGLDLESRAVSIAVHPLSRVGESVSGRVLVVHLQVLDAEGRPTRSSGPLRVELRRGKAGARLDEAEIARLLGQAAERVWDVTLDSGLNPQTRFDALVTQTYVLEFGGLPEWAEQWASDARSDRQLAENQPVLTVRLTPPSVPGEPIRETMVTTAGVKR